MTTPSPWLSGPDDLCRALGIPFSSEQLEAICGPLEPTVIIAGAGSGKTTVMAARVVWLVGTGQVRPEQVLGLTFTRKAAGELSSRVSEALASAGVVDADDAEAGEPVVLTYDAFAGRLLDTHGLRMGREGGSVMITGAQRYLLALRAIRSTTGEFERLPRLHESSIAERVPVLDSALRAHLVTTAQVRDQARGVTAQIDASPRYRGDLYASMRDAALANRERTEFVHLTDAYQRAKEAAGITEFADQMAEAARLVGLVPDVSALVRAEFPVVLLDEYQDTSAAQAALLRQLFSGPVPPGRGHPVTAVGDPFQAIYGWRGAAAANIAAFATDFPRADGSPAAVRSLTVNRRSGERILVGANAVAAALQPTGGAEPRQLIAAPGTSPGRLEVARYETWPEEVAALCDDIIAHHGQSTASGAGLTWRDVAVLLRRNIDVGTVFAALRERDVPCEIVGLSGLLAVPEVADVVSYLHAINDSAANPAMVRILTGPRWAIGAGDLDVLGRRALELAGMPQSAADADVHEELLQAVATTDASATPSLVDAVADPGAGPYSSAGRERLRALALELDSLRRRAGAPLLDLVRDVIDTIGVDVELAATPASWRRGADSQLRAFEDAVASWARLDPHPDLAAVMAWLTAESEHGAGLEQATPSPADAVKVLTMHKAKGLEWEHVYLPSLVDSVFPSNRASENWLTSAHTIPSSLRGDAPQIPQPGILTNDAARAYAEDLKQEARRAEDRLAYVAVTRAKQRLVASGHWWRPERVKALGPGAYLDQLWPGADAVLADAPAPPDGAANPCPQPGATGEWPAPLDPEATQRRLEAAALVTSPPLADPRLTLDEQAIVDQWDVEIDHLVAMASAGPREVPLPPALSASRVLAARRDPNDFAADLLRPMPAPPSAAARVGTAFHEWVERRFVDVLPGLIPDEVHAGPLTAAEREELAALREAFASGAFAERTPYVVEEPFSLAMAVGSHTQVVRGRIDAVYADGDDWLVVDWKTNARQGADPWQLALYRWAWATRCGVAAERVRAAFYYVRTDRLVEPELPSDGEVAAWFAGLDGERSPR